MDYAMNSRPVTLTLAWTCPLAGDAYHELRAPKMDGRPVVPISVDGVQRLDLYDPAHGPVPVGQLPGAPAEVQSLCAVIGNGRELVVTATREGHIQVWDLATKTHAAAFDTGELWAIGAVQVRDTELIGAGCDTDSMVSLWNPDGGARVGAVGDLDISPTMMCTLLSYGRRLLATANGDEDHVQIWDLAKNEEWARLDGQRGGTAAICAVGDPVGDQLIATSDCFGGLSTWDPTTGEKVATITGHQGSAHNLFPVHAGGLHLLASTADADDHLRLWDPATGDQVADLALPAVGMDGVQAGDHLLFQYVDGIGACQITVG
jgi:WD40 repeat protein